ncbi:hypothetical protein WLZ19_21845 [Bordetella bronchiseptica]|uniref:hypothetical protein n=1 Tax=Bordetella bronchiseptica TaxID=518 RepID=UPI0004A0F444|nr:hypothetical protein [Bordetella bronchiseptica]AXT88332.1 hypothetical protein CJ015_07195 [Bordetella bronchiseptica]KDC65020.1 hypothetical protein L512_3597 [Bordetella bronchiseptica MBORD624]KDS76403.1 phage protein [Bordetella bronchiseptica KM22]
MANDWIKMRTDLYRDPRICVMADILMNEDGELARYVNQHCQRHMSVTRNVMRNVTVGALVSVWGVMRLRGKAEGTDLVCRAVTTSVLDDIADLPGMGAAMEAVGWVVSTAEGLVFPRFFEDHNVDPDASPKSKSAARQQRYRERQKLESDVTRNVTRNVTRDAKVTPREEKSREEKDNPQSPLPGAEGWRLPDWIPADPWRQFEEMRRKKKKPMTDAARKLAVTKLDTLRAAGHDVATMMDQSILHAWDTFYPPKADAALQGALGSDQPWTGAV